MKNNFNLKLITNFKSCNQCVYIVSYFDLKWLNNFSQMIFFFNHYCEFWKKKFKYVLIIQFFVNKIYMNYLFKWLIYQSYFVDYFNFLDHNISDFFININIT